MLGTSWALSCGRLSATETPTNTHAYESGSPRKRLLSNWIIKRRAAQLLRSQDHQFIFAQAAAKVKPKRAHSLLEYFVQSVLLRLVS